jgi:DNA-binding NarL/FixJ family response regulator
MAKVFLVHWNEAECVALASALRRGGHEVVIHWSTETGAPLKDALPDVLVISLDRLPSHGRAVAEWLWEAKKRQHIPIVFAGGEPAKVQATRNSFPKARFCSTKSLLDTIGKVTGS